MLHKIIDLTFSDTDLEVLINVFCVAKVVIKHQVQCCGLPLSI